MFDRGDVPDAVMLPSGRILVYFMAACKKDGPGEHNVNELSVAVSDEHLYWSYDGEFWRDELGTYTYTLTKGCRDAGARAGR